MSVERVAQGVFRVRDFDVVLERVRDLVPERRERDERVVACGPPRQRLRVVAL